MRFPTSAKALELTGSNLRCESCRHSVLVLYNNQAILYRNRNICKQVLEQRRLFVGTNFHYALALASVAMPALSQSGNLVDKEIVGHVLRPEKLAADSRHISLLKAPAGFQIQKIAENLGKARILAVGPDGSVYVTRPEAGDCLLLRDKDGDQRLDQQTVVARKPHLHGIAIHGDSVYFATVHEIYVAARHPDGTLGELKQIAGNLPDGGQHANRTIAVGPDGLLYVSVGSTCNACSDPNPENATILRMNLDGSGRESSRRACETPSASDGVPIPSNSSVWITERIGLAMMSRRKNSTSSPKGPIMVGHTCTRTERSIPVSIHRPDSTLSSTPE